MSRPPTRLPFFQVDAFSDRPFQGNPAAVVVLERWPEPSFMQAVAMENQLSETAFIVQGDEGWAIRWFTPTAEVSLCGHATLAAACVIMTRVEPARARVSFDSQSGPLHVTREEGRYTLELPVQPLERVDPPAALAAGLGVEPLEVWRSLDWLAVLPDEAAVRALAPDMRTLAGLAERGVIVTARGASPGVDFVSRFFGPGVGIDEDPVTGSAHCALTPYWAPRLGRTCLRARQLSARGGELLCTLDGERVRLTGDAVLVIEGTFFA
jgi:PhzF family phenazine biosynthesis protein